MLVRLVLSLGWILSVVQDTTLTGVFVMTLVTGGSLFIALGSAVTNFSFSLFLLRFLLLLLRRYVANNKFRHTQMGTIS